MTKADSTKDRIVDHALAVASLDGLSGLTLGHLADVVGMSKSGLFAHFASKEQLQLDVIARARARFMRVVFQPALSAPRGEPRLRALFERWMQWECDEALPGGCVFVRSAAALDDGTGPARDALAAAQQDWLDALTHAARLGLDAGHFRADVDPALFAFQLWSLALGYHYARHTLRDPHADQRVRAAFDALVVSVRRRATDA
jgi:AcrR family transcriptional regulator